MTTIAPVAYPPAMFPTMDLVARSPYRAERGWRFGAESGFDLVESGAGRYRLTVDVAGYDKSDLSVEQHPDALVIRGEQTDDRTRGSGRTVSHRSFRRIFTLPEPARMDSATLRTGLLAVELNTDWQPAGQAVRIPISEPKAGRLQSRFASTVKSLFRRLPGRRT